MGPWMDAQFGSQSVSAKKKKRVEKENRKR
jgi:hypothetical protein